MRCRRLAPLIAILLLPAAAQEREDLKRARAALRSGDYETAERTFRRLAAARPDSWEPRAGLTRALLERGRRPEAAAACEEFLKASPAHAGALAALARALLEQGEPARALATAERALPDVRARALAAEALVRLDRIDDAIRTAEPLVEAHAKGRDDFMKESLLAVAEGLILYAAYSGASDVYRQVVHTILPDILRADPADAAVRAFLGRCYLEKYNRNAAEQAFNEALQANANCVPALAGLAVLRLEANQPAPAIEACGRALAVNAAHEEAHALKTEALLRQGNREAATAAAARGLEANPRSVRLHALRAAVRFVAADAGYEEDAKRALEINPRSPLPWWEIARACVGRGEWQYRTAQDFFRRAVEQNGKIPDLLVDYGMNCLRTGDEETGRRILLEANRRDPFHVRVQNTVNLLRDFEGEYDLIPRGKLRLRLGRRERKWMEPEAAAILDRAWREMVKRYGFEPPPLLVEIFPNHTDFSVRTAGVPGVGALGVCFGTVVASLSPRARAVPGANLPPYAWGAVLWHEMAHAFALELSGYRVPQWFTEGLSTYEEGLGSPAWERRSDLEILQARHRGDLGGVKSLESGRAFQNRILHVYLQGSLICAFIAEKHGFEAIPRLLRLYGERKKTPEAFAAVLGKTVEEFDRAFFEWLDARLARIRYLLPPKESTTKLLADATADPKNAAANARAARALLASGNAKDALRWAKLAAEADPSSAEARSACGQALYGTRQVEESVEHLRRGTDDYRTWDTLGRALAELERWKEAADAFRRAVDCFPRLIEDPPRDSAYRRLNAACLAAKDTDGAARALEAMVAQDPTDFRNRIKLARLYEERHDADRMAAILEEAGAIETRDVALHDLAASAHRGRKEFAKATERTWVAIALIEAGETKDPDADRAERLCAIGEDFLALGQKEKAAALAQEALRLVSGHERARRLFDAARER